jgi:hypothetical protein
MRFRPSPRLVAGALALALLAALVIMLRPGDSSSSQGRTVTLRADPVTGPFQGLGVWVDVYDQQAWADPAAAVSDMAAHGVKTLYLETSNDKRNQAFVFPDGVASFVDAAAADGVQIVAWYLPGFADVGLDRTRSLAAIRYRTPAGNAFTGFALDIESPDVKNPAVRTRRLMAITDTLRVKAGPTYPLGAIIPSPKMMLVNPAYWPGFPFERVAAAYDAFLPMTYFTYRASGEAGARNYAAACIRLLRHRVGSDLVPIHLIGGIAQDATTEETRGFVAAVQQAGILGASYYTWPGITQDQWGALARVPSHPPPGG